MTDTSRLNLPLLAPSQAQKHVTVNEALSRLDALVQLALASVTLATPPLSPTDGDAYGVPVGAVNAWAGQEGRIAIFVNAGWAFVPATQGMRAYVVDQGFYASYNGTTWVEGMQSLSPSGAGMIQRTIEIDHVIGAGATSNVPFALPSQSVVFGVTGRVTTAITGTATGFSLGVAASSNRYGSGLSMPQGSWLRGLTGAPVTYYAAEDLILTGEGGDFAGGEIRLAVHCLQFALPN
ncbi:DUF2793 domain-containing protein [Celeribacter sp.]|uniref:DUF2793 domain-containing protein n=1 Tax=Celeribacter sp. TaxID=1890673 RepID=UPI003A91E690